METTESKSTRSDIFERLNRNRKSSFSLRMAPMIDMVFLLLIFFLVAAKWRPEENFLPFQLPAVMGQEGKIGRPEPLILHIFATESGCRVQIGQLDAVRINNERIEADMAVLMQKMRDCMVAQKRFATDPIEIICEPDVKSEYWISIYNVLYGMKLSDITFSMTE